MGRNLLEPVQPLPVFNAEKDLVDLICASSNPLTSWLRRIEALRDTAYFESSVASHLLNYCPAVGCNRANLHYRTPTGSA